MATDVQSEAAAAPVDAGRRPYRFTAEQFWKLVDARVFPEIAHVELVRGRIYRMTRKFRDERHGFTIRRMADLLGGMRADGVYVRDSKVLRHDRRSVLEPDVAVVPGRVDVFRPDPPSTSEATLIVEICMGTRWSDYRQKARLYAAAKTPAYWVVDVEGRKIDVFTQPRGFGPSAAYSRRLASAEDSPLPVVLDGREVGRLFPRDVLPPAHAGGSMSAADDAKAAVASRDPGRRSYHFTTKQFRRILDRGVIPDESGVELVNGRIYLTTKHGPHCFVVGELAERLRSILPSGFHVREEKTLDHDGRSLPEPDVAVVRGARSDYRVRNPKSSEAALVVEVCAGTRRADYRQKLNLYAAAGVPVYWVVDVEGRKIDVFTDPRGAGRDAGYARRETFAEGAPAPVVLDGREAGRIDAADVLPPIEKPEPPKPANPTA